MQTAISNVYQAVLCGNRKLAGHLVEEALKDPNTGFGYLHKDVSFCEMNYVCIFVGMKYGGFLKSFCLLVFGLTDFFIFLCVHALQLHTLLLKFKFVVWLNRKS